MPTELSISNDGQNETVTFKKRLRVSEVNIKRGGHVTFSTERAVINNATEADTIVNAGPQVIRNVEAASADTVSHGGQNVSFGTVLTILGKFHAKWKAEDDAPPAP